MTQVDVIGAIYAVQAVSAGWMPGDPLEPAVRVWGFHVNVTAAVMEAHPELGARVITPASLVRVWSGDDPASPTETVALRFNGENAAREALGDLWPEEIA